MTSHRVKRQYVWLAFGLLCLVAGQAQQPLPESLLIGPGDDLHIQVFKRPELEQHVRVTDQGTIAALLAGSVVVKGLTPEQASHTIESQLVSGGFLLHPHVTISVDTFATQSIYVLGQVRTPAAIAAPVPRSVTEVLSQAGGLIEGASSHITIRRRETGELIPYHITNDAAEAFSQHILVYPGDTVFVARAPMVYVLGNVEHPGGYPMNDNHGALTALEAFAAAGGAPPTASPGHSTLVRKTHGDAHEVMHISLDDMRKGKTQDLALQPDDILYIPFSHLKNIEVGLPGILSAAASASIYTVH